MRVSDPVQDELEAAVARGDVEAVRAAVEAGADPNGFARIAPVRLAERMTMLHFAARRGQARAARALIEVGASLEPVDSRGVTPLGEAVAFDQVEVVRALLAAGADPEKHGGKLSPVNVAYLNKNLEIFELLLTAGANVPDGTLAGSDIKFRQMAAAFDPLNERSEVAPERARQGGAK